jgi:hypothetical protein
MILAPCSVGDALDRLSILSIKKHKLATDPEKLAHVESEYEALYAVSWDYLEHQPVPDLYMELQRINSDLWEVEDSLRDKERAKDFGTGFVELARSVYILNDARAAVKRRINGATGSRLTEVKSYAVY